MTTLTTINISGLIKLNEYSIGNAADRLSKNGKALKSTFLLGPSGSVMDHGEIHLSDKAPAGIEDNEDNKPEESTNQPEEGQPSQSEQGGSSQPPSDSGSSGNASDGGPNNGGNESFHYSIFEAYYNTLHVVNEEGENGDAAPSGDGGQPSGNNGSSSSDTQSQESSDSSDQDQSSDDNSDKNDDKKDDSKNDQGSFKPGKDYFVQVLLKGEGCTVWHVLLDERVEDIDAVLGHLQKKAFKLAMATAKKGLSSDGLVPLSATTYVAKSADCGCPFIGHCRYAMDSGSERAEDDANTVVIAVAPINGVTKKPSEDIVYKVVYNITGDITNGELKFLNDLKDNDTVNGQVAIGDVDKEGGKSEEASVSEVVSKWLNSKYKCVGDHTMYQNFLKLREFVMKRVEEKTLEKDVDESEDPKHFSKVPALKKSLIFY